jgi:hypothetical protein
MIQPSANAIDIGDGCFIEFAEWGGAAAGINEFHRDAAGAWCAGWVAFKGSLWSLQFEKIEGFQCWDVIKSDPLTLSPSIKCTACGHHGHIKNGRWAPA